MMTALRANYENLRQHILRLTDIIEDCMDIDAVVYQFPDHTVEDLGAEVNVIPIVAHKGRGAIEKALLHYTHFQADIHQPMSFVRKLAGTLLIECDKSTELEIRQRIATINQLKSQFEQLILSLNTVPDVRFEMFKDALPNMCKLSITRQIPLALPSIKRINFTWTNRKVGGSIKQEDLIARIRAARLQPKPSDIAGDWLAGLDREEKLVASYSPNAVFIEKRPARVTAMLRLFYPSAHKPKETSMHAHSPLIIINDKPRIGELKTYIKPEEKEKSEEAYELVIPRLHLYLLTKNGIRPGSEHDIDNSTTHTMANDIQN